MSILRETKVKIKENRPKCDKMRIFSSLSFIKGAVPCLPRELTTVREVVYKQCSHMRRGRNTCFRGRTIFQLGSFCPVILVGDGRIYG